MFSNFQLFSAISNHSRHYVQQFLVISSHPSHFKTILAISSQQFPAFPAIPSHLQPLQAKSVKFSQGRPNTAPRSPLRVLRKSKSMKSTYKNIKKFLAIFSHSSQVNPILAASLELH